VAAVLDPACNYRFDLVPYAAERIPALMLAHVGLLWLGAQLLALLAVVASTSAAASTATPYAAAAEATADQGIPTSSRRSRRWPVLPWETLGVLQVRVCGTARGRVTVDSPVAHLSLANARCPWPNAAHVRRKASYLQNTLE
jgi:hypothetical protein